MCGSIDSFSCAVGNACNRAWLDHEVSEIVDDENGANRAKQQVLQNTKIMTAGLSPLDRGLAQDMTPIFSRRDIDISKRLGSDKFGTVYLARERQSHL